MALNQKRGRVTLSTVAKHAGVALSTASVILSHGSGPFRNFSEETVTKVRKSAAKLGYRTNLFASGLPTRGSSIFFAVALHDLHDPLVTDRFRWGFDGDLLGGVSETALEFGTYPIVTLAKPEQAEWNIDAVDRVIGGGVFGAIVRTPSKALEVKLRDYIRTGCSIVVVFPEVLSQWKTNVIDVDNRAMGRQAGQILAANDRKQWLAIVNPEDCGAHSQRLAGLRTVARELGAKVDVLNCEATLDAQQTQSRIEPELRRLQPEGVFALTSRTSEGVLHACRSLGINVGSDILLVGCDCSLWNTSLLRRVTSLEASWRHAGQAAMRQLIQMRDAGAPRCPRLLLPPLVLPGETCPVPESLELNPVAANPQV